MYILLVFSLEEIIKKINSLKDFITNKKIIKQIFKYIERRYIEILKII